MSSRFAVETIAAQQLWPGTASQRFEGLSFSASGDVLGAATADTNSAMLFRRGSGGRFDDQPFCTIQGLDYPHGLAFARFGDTEFLAIAQRTGAIAVFRRNEDGSYGPQPELKLTGADAKLEYTDGVAFVPPHNGHVAACNLTLGTIVFHGIDRSFNHTPFELRHPVLVQPDGLAFSQCGKWLATANHGGGTVAIFKRNGKKPNRKPPYDPDPVIVINDQDLRYPHSVAFTSGRHLAVTNAGANYINFYHLKENWLTGSCRVEAAGKLVPANEATFREINAQNKMEGGPKGLAIHGQELAVCSPEFGIKIFRFRE